MGDWLVYLLRCRDNSLYCGITNNLPRRLKAHARGKVKYSRGKKSVRVVWVESAQDRGAALRREAAVKQLSKAAKELLVVEGFARQNVQEIYHEP